ncbi:MAG: sulfite exporter TauE/SafE family protein [Candidatus Omnitrophota bacterium]|nr:sulfite exporter TauE/SafE family protein [Candidatus Omnitrophota bacterium]MDZ4241693.1 sulfite exporter TauE/SafE family protein [Candidatus Omnitrophota bacterium]
MVFFSYLLIGLLGGVFSGAFGIGGGTIMVPALVLLMGMGQHQAQGTTLAVLMVPVSILAVLQYYHAGHVKVAAAMTMALGFVFGALAGAYVIQNVSDANLKRAFGLFLVAVGAKMIFSK